MNDVKNFTATYGYDQYNKQITWGYAQWLHVDQIAGQHNKETQFFDCYKNNRKQPGMTETANRIAEHLQYLYSQQDWQLQTRIARSMCYVNSNNNERYYGSAGQVITVFQTIQGREEPVFAVLLFHDDTAIVNGARSQHNGRWQFTFPQRNMRDSLVLVEQLAGAEIL